ncbi:MAG: SRPBCC family protein [Deltaproteobacteria bacterium]|nr:SRPBCC family protein [Deltaproteobacteria bacterium]
MDSLSASRRLSPGQEGDGANLSRGLGWFSIGLGLTELVAPRRLARAIGISPGGRTQTTVRAMGIRELLQGIGILFRPRSAGPTWSRVVGDVIDLALLGWSASAKRTNTQRVAGAMVAVVGTTALDLYASQRLSRARKPEPVIATVTINRPPEEVYVFWRRLENLPLFMDDLESVTQTSDTRSHWIAKSLLGSIEWDAEIIEDRPGELIAWRSVEGSKFATSGVVTFAKAPGRIMTEVRVEMQVGLQGLKPSTALAKLVARPQVKGDLRRLKQVIETGEILYSDASIHKRPHPAQPSAELPLAGEKGVLP